MEHVDEVGRRRWDPRSKSLWILAIVLVGVGLVLTVGLQLYYADQIATGPDPLGSIAITVLQIGGALGPSLLTSGLLTAAIALALRAVLDQLGRRDVPQYGTLRRTADESAHDVRDDRPLDPQDVILGTTPGDR